MPQPFGGVVIVGASKSGMLNNNAKKTKRWSDNF